MTHWYLTALVCPRDYTSLTQSGSWLLCAAGHRYRLVDGVPVMLLDDVTQTMGIAEESLARAREGPLAADAPLGALYLSTLGLSDDEKRGIRARALEGTMQIDPVVAYAVGATSGLMYSHLIGTLDRYPIPQLRLPRGNGHTLLDVGCNWGRWSIAAVRRGYAVTGIDPSLGSIMAARRVSQSLGLSIRYVVGDARYLPFPAESFGAAFSYSVLQHLSETDAARAVSEIGRTLKRGGTSLVQMPTPFGLRCLYHQARRRFRRARGFEVRYWTIPRLEALFSRAIGPATTSVDCYFGIGLQRSDWPIMSPFRKVVLATSELFRGISRAIPALKYVADSVYVSAVKS
ncbi:MAG: methyltransferase domain-containing protein [Acidobacteria bacterium]|nr:methyltransferase domain-containing protein [Acidobacteriota bacterium]